MNQEQEKVLLEELAQLRDEVPPMPEDLHARWMSAVEEDAMMENKERKTGTASQWKRMLSVAAALVFVVGGTLLTKDQLPGARSQEKSYQAAAYGSTQRNAPKLDTYYASDDVYEYEMTESVSYDNGAGLYSAKAGLTGMPEETAERQSKIIRTVSMSISTRTYEDSMQSLRALCEENGGWVSWSSETENTNGLRRANMTLRIPSEKLDAFLQGSAGVGRVTSRSESMDDVSDSYYDTAMRLETQKALMARLQALTTAAADLSDLLELEEQMADTQYQIDRLTGSLQSTDRKVAYSTVDISLREETDADALTSPEMTLGERIVSALKTGLETFADFAADMAVFLMAALPFIAAVAVVIVIIKLIRKSRKTK